MILEEFYKTAKNPSEPELISAIGGGFNGKANDACSREPSPPMIIAKSIFAVGFKIYKLKTSASAGSLYTSRCNAYSSRIILTKICVLISSLGLWDR